jgi:hypothetical protein
MNTSRLLCGKLNSLATDRAVIPGAHIVPPLKAVKDLRLTDETLYLRSASINAFNGMIGLSFSCDGSH